MHPIDSAPTQLRTMLVIVAVFPLFLALLAVVGVVRYQFEHLAKAQSSLSQPILLQARKDEIQHFVQIGKRAVAEIEKGALSEQLAQHQALEMLRRMDFGNDNYFFVYDLKGTNLMHPRLSSFEGRNHLQLVDQNGNFIIQTLIQTASSGGGFVNYMWHRPSTGKEEHKLGYVELIPEWGWMIGTGLYLDHLKETQELITNSAASAMEKTRNQVLLIASMALFGVTAGGLLLNWREQRRANARLRFMAQQVVQSQENERRRVSRELHDGIHQTLAALKFSLESTLLLMKSGNPKMEETLKSSIGMVSSSMQDVRRISHDLRPVVLDDMDLKSALQQFLREYSDRLGLSVHLEISVLPWIPEEVTTTVFRVVQEALSNIEKHANAKNIDVQIRHDIDSNQLVLMIVDDGCGFDVNYQFQHLSSGLGLTNMRERIEMLNGYWSLKSSAGCTQLKALIPLRLNPERVP
jgi:two-component system, NarL family, sensor kinase